jgi:uncharacterized membrane protein YfcA
VNPTDILGGLLAGGVGGIASGFLGITSGGILVPLLVLLLGKTGTSPRVFRGSRRWSPPASPACAITARAVIASRCWLIWLACGFAIGGCVGALLATHVSDRALQWTFVGYLVILLTLVASRPPCPKMEATGDLPDDLPMHWAALATIGAIAGWSSGFLGIGGGFAITALMAGVMKVSQHLARAMSLAVTALPVTLPAALFYVQQGTELPWLTIVSVIVGLWVGTDIGARFANRVAQANCVSF